MKHISEPTISQRGFGALSIVLVIAVIALLGAAGVYTAYKQNRPVTTMESQSQLQNTEPVAQMSPPASGSAGAKDTSDKALDSDTANITAHLNALNTDSVGVDQSLNTTPEDLSQ